METIQNVKGGLYNSIQEYSSMNENHCNNKVTSIETKNNSLALVFSNEVRDYRLNSAYNPEAADDNIVPMLAIVKGEKILERQVGLPTETIKFNAIL